MAENKRIWPNTENLAEYSASLKYEDLSDEAVEAAKEIMLDTIGALFAAWPDRHPASRLIGDFVEQMGGTPECTVLGRGFKAPAANAALVNGTMGYAADIEGGGISRMHAAAVYVPTVLLMSEREKTNGKTLIASLALAYDISSRVSEANNTEHSYPHSFHPSAVFTTFGAAAITGFNLSLDSDQFTNAYGLAGNVASGLIAWVDDPTEHSRPYGMGVAARNGVTAGLLAQKGFGGPRGIFDPMKYNIFDAFSGAMHLEELGKDLGVDLRITHAREYKQYPCCGDIHSGIDALLAILDENNLHTEEIVEIIHEVRDSRHLIIDNNPLKSHNSQYIMAVAAVDRQIRWNDFLHDRRMEPAIGKMAMKTRLVGSTELDNSTSPRPAVVEVRVKDGRSFRKRVDSNKGRQDNPLSREELEVKFMSLAERVVGNLRAREIISMISRLEVLEDAGDLVRLMG